MNSESSKSLRVNKIHLKGIEKTDEEFIKRQVLSKAIFNTTSLKELNKCIDDAVSRLRALDIFDPSIDVTIDKSRKHGYTGLPNLDLIFKVKEKRVLNTKVNALCKTDNKIGLHLDFVRSNIRGKGEKLIMEGHHDFNNCGGGTITLEKPLESMPHCKIGAGVWCMDKDFYWSHFTHLTNGMFLQNKIDTSLGHHTISYEAISRALKVNEGASDVIKPEEAKKYCLKHRLVRDRTRYIVTCCGKLTSMFPVTGYRISLFQELFQDNPVDDVARSHNLHLKLLGELHKFVRLGSSIVLENSIHLGAVKTLTSQQTQVPVPDRFFLGGPLDLRGFKFCGIGPMKSSYQCDSSTNQNASLLGFNSYWLYGVHVYTQIPLLTHRFFKKYCRIHGFWTAGSNSLIDDASVSLMENLKKSLEYMRSSVGLGIVLKVLNGIRLECNYCVPIKWGPDDKLSSLRGFQLGIGVDYL